jgi:transposase-like protein
MVASVAEVAWTLEVNSNVLHRWRREFRERADNATSETHPPEAKRRQTVWRAI